MRQSSCSPRAAVLALLLCALSTAALSQATGNDSDVTPAVAQKQSAEISKGDPPRWYNEPNSTEGRLSILLKEIDSAYAEARNDCRKRPTPERGACLKEAGAVWQHDKAHARELVQATPGGAVMEPVPAK